MKPNRILLAATLLTLGVGGSTVIHAQDPNGPPPPPPRGGPGGPGGPPNPLQDLVRSLQLTDAEKTAFQATLDSSNAQVRAIHLDAMAKTAAVVTTTAAALRPSLAADQQTALDTFLTRLSSRLAKEQAKQ